MKRVMLMMVLAALLLTQCRRPSIEFPSAEVSMTVTAGPSSKTDISTEGGIVWSTGDKLYVGCNGKYAGCLSIVSGVGNPTGTFTGTVTGVPEGTQEFHFFYLGNAKDYSSELTTSSTSVPVDFSNQDIYADGGKLMNANRQHVGYGTASGKVDGGYVIGVLDVAMKSKVAIAYFHFESGTPPTPYEGALTLGGDHIYSSMTVGFGGTFSPGTKGDISIAGGHAGRYVMLVPPENVANETLNFSGSATGATALENGIEANKFYRVDGSMPIVVKVTAPSYLPGEFTVNSSSTKVKFSKGNLQYIGNSDGTGTWRFAEHQWDIMGAGPSAASNRGNVDLGTEYSGKYNTGSGNAGGSETDADKAAARDLFGWGCTGHQDTRKDNHTNWYQKNYQPYSTSTSIVNTTYNYYGYGPDYDANKYNLSVENKSDWGCLKIGDDPAGTWRTLTSAEWKYLLDTRTVNGGTGEGKSYRRATINSDGTGVYGMLLYPDGYTSQTGATTYTAEQFRALEQAGVVFLPAAGYRDGASLYAVGSSGTYCSSSCSSSNYAYYMYFRSGNVNPQYGSYRCNGRSVRLVR